LIRTYYFYRITFLSSSPSDEDRKRHDAAQRFLNKLRMIDRLEVVIGKLELRGFSTNGEPILVQKRVDIALAFTLARLSYSQ